MTTRTLAAAQGAFYVATGAWPLVSMASFEAVTGPKRDHWLVNTVGVLVGVIGVTLIASARTEEPAPEIKGLAAGAALALAAVDIFYVSQRTIAKVYLVDAAAELALVAAWSRVRRVA
jgi:hypothetical protein